MKFEANGVDGWTSASENVSSRTNSAPADNASPSTTEASKVKSKMASMSEPTNEEDAGEKLAAEMKVFNATASELRGALNLSAPFGERVSNLMLAATDLFGLAPTWTAFYREILGAEGLMRHAVIAGDEMTAFECSAEHTQLLEMLTTLRSRDLPENDPFEQQRMITVRIPKSLHDSICAEANELSVSVNKLCISRMLQKVDKVMIPACGKKRRGRRPGSASNRSQGANNEQVISGKVTTGETSPNFIRTSETPAADAANKLPPQAPRMS